MMFNIDTIVVLARKILARRTASLRPNIHESADHEEGSYALNFATKEDLPTPCQLEANCALCRR